MFGAVAGFASRLIPGLGFLAPLIPYAIALVVGGGLVIGVYQAGAKSARRQCQEAALRAELAAVRRDLTISQQAAADADRRAKSLEQSTRADDERIKRLEADIAKRPVDRRCLLTPDDLRRMRR